MWILKPFFIIKGYASFQWEWSLPANSIQVEYLQQICPDF